VLEAEGVEVIYLDLCTKLQSDPVDLLYGEVSLVLRQGQAVRQRNVDWCWPKARLSDVSLYAADLVGYVIDK